MSHAGAILYSYVFWVEILCLVAAAFAVHEPVWNGAHAVASVPGRATRGCCKRAVTARAGE